MSEKSSIRCLFLFSLLGVLNGFVIDRLLAFDIYHVIPYLFTSAWVLLFTLAYDERHTPRLILTSFIATILICLPVIMVNFNYPKTFNAGSIIMLVSLPFYAYVIHSFHHAYHIEGRFKNTYTSLYNCVWHTYIVIIVATIFAGVANGILQISGWGFKTLGFDFLFPIIQKIIFPYYGFILYFGLAITKQFEKLTNQLRLLILKMAYYLYPVIIIFTIIFFVLYIIRNPLWMPVARNVSGSDTLLVMVLIGILNFNAYFRDGFTHNEHVLLVYLSKVYRVILFLCALLVINQVIRDRSDIDIYLYLLLLFLFTGAYAISVFFSVNIATRFIQRANISIALFYIAAIIIIHNPIHPLSNDHNDFKPFPFESNRHLSTAKHDPVDLRVKIKSIDNDLTKLGLNWIPSTSMISNIANVSICPSLKQGICRVQYQKGYQIGRWAQGQCIITYAGKQLTFSTAQILTGDLKNLIWRPSLYASALQVPLGIEYMTQDDTTSTRLLYACRALTGDQLLVGKKIDFNCNISVRGKEIIINNLFQELGKKS